MKDRLRLLCVAFFGCVVGIVATLDMPRLDGAAPPAAAAPVNKGNTTLYGFELPVRKIGEKTVTPATARIGIEVVRDENNGNLIYISHTGSIAVVPGK